jgi:hypothetical protein
MAMIAAIVVCSLGLAYAAPKPHIIMVIQDDLVGAQAWPCSVIAATMTTDDHIEQILHSFSSIGSTRHDV